MTTTRKKNPEPTDPVPAAGEYEDKTHPAHPLHTVRLAHHWVDDTGAGHRPGDQITVTKALADGLRRAGYLVAEPRR